MKAARIILIDGPSHSMGMNLEGELPNTIYTAGLIVHSVQTAAILTPRHEYRYLKITRGKTAIYEYIGMR